MDQFLSIFYGVCLILVIYWISYVSVKGLIGKGAMPFYLVLGKYFIYWKAITLGFRYLSPSWILVGTVAGIYLSFPVWYVLNKKMSPN